MERDHEPLGAPIRRARERCGLSRELLAVKANVSGPAVVQIETGHRDPSLKALDRIAKVLGVTAGQLIDARELLEADDDTEAELVEAGAHT